MHPAPGVGIWPREKSLWRVLKCDGIIVETRSSDGKGEEVTPAHICDIKNDVDANRTLTTAFDIVVVGKATGLSRAQGQAKLLPRQEAGLTWWIEDLISEPEEQVIAHIRQGPPQPDGSFAARVDLYLDLVSGVKYPHLTRKAYPIYSNLSTTW